MMENQTIGKVKGIISNLLMVEVENPVGQSEICFVQHGEVSLMGEVIKITGKTTYVQVFESTRGLQVNTSVFFTGNLLEVELGPGILSRKYDGLQNDLDALEGIFLERGGRSQPLDPDKSWEFSPLEKVGASVAAGHWIGEVQENILKHKIMVPLSWEGNFTITSINQKGTYKAS